MGLDAIAKLAHRRAASPSDSCCFCLLHSCALRDVDEVPPVFQTNILRLSVLVSNALLL